MKNNITFTWLGIFFLMVFYQSLVAQNKVSENTGQLCARYVSIIGNEYKVQNEDNYYKEVYKNKLSYDEAVKKAEQLIQVYQQKKESSDIGLSFLSGNNILIEGTIGVGLALAPATGGASLVAVVGGLLTSKGLDKVASLAESSSRESIRRHVKTIVVEFGDNYGTRAQRKLERAGTPEEFRKILENKMGPILNDVFSDIGEESRDIVNSFYNKELANIIDEGLNNLNVAVYKNASEIKRNEENIKNIGLTFLAFADSTKAQIDGILKTQARMASNIATINGKLDKTDENVRFMQEYLFSKMDPEEQLNALNMGMVGGNLSEKERNELTAKIQLTQDRIDLEKNITKYLNAGKDLVGIAKNIGVDPNLVKTMDDALQIGNAAFSVYTDFMKHDYLGALNTVTSMFGGKKKDVGAERHKQVMQMLGRLYQNQAVIIGKLDSLELGQQKIMQNQVDIYKAILSLAGEVQKNHNEVMTKLELIHNDINYNRRLIISQSFQNYALCDLFNRRISDNVIVCNVDSNIFPSLDYVNAIFTNNKSECKNCLDELTIVKTTDDKVGSRLVHPKFWLRTLDKDGQAKSAKFIEGVYKPLLLLVNDSSLMVGAGGEAFYAKLNAPSLTLDVLNRKYKHLVANLDVLMDLKVFFSQEKFEDLMDDFLSPSTILEHVKQVLITNNYQMLVNDNLDPIPLPALETQTTIRETGLDRLYESLRLLDVCIIQQTLLSGDALLPIMGKVFDDYATNAKDATFNSRFKVTREALKNNAVLAYNFFKYKIGQEVSDNASLGAYFIAFHAKPSAIGADASGLLKKVTLFPYEFKYVQREKDYIDGWYIVLDDEKYQLPSPEELQDGDLLHRGDIYELTSAKEKVLNEIANYSIYTDVNDSLDRKMLNQLILEGL